MTLSDGGHEWALQADLVSVDGVNGSLWDAEATIGVSHGCNINGFPLDGHSSSGEDLLHGSGDLWANSVARDQGDFAVARGEGSQLSGRVSRVDLKV